MSSRAGTGKASGRVVKPTKIRKKPGSRPVLTSKSANEESPQPTRKAYGISIWQLLSDGDIDSRPDSPPKSTDGGSVQRSRYLPSPLDPLTSHRGNSGLGFALPNAQDYSLMDYWLATAPKMLRLDILPPSQQNRRPAHELFFPMASRSIEAMEHIIMLPAALAWAKSSPPSEFVNQMLSFHRAKCVRYLNDAITQLVEQKIMEEYTHIGLMSLIWAENTYGNAKQAQAYSLVFREMVQLRLKQKLKVGGRHGTILAHWYNAMTTVNFWPKGNLKQKDLVDAESLLRPMFPFLEAVRYLAQERKFSAAYTIDRQKYLAPSSPITKILLSADPFNITSYTNQGRKEERYIRFRGLLLFRVLLFIHVGLLDTSSYTGPTLLKIYFDKLEAAISHMDILSSPSPLALLLWAILNDSSLSTVEAHRTIAMWIYPLRRLGIDWLTRLNKLLLVWLGLPIAESKFPSIYDRYSDINPDRELESLPNMLMNLVMTDNTQDSDESSDDQSHDQQGYLKQESSRQGVT